MVRCINCGYCAFYMGLRTAHHEWIEMEQHVRDDFKNDTDFSTRYFGQNASIGHYQNIKCAKFLNEWPDWERDIQREERKVRKLMKDERNCSGYFEYYPGLSPKEHHRLSIEKKSLSYKQWATLIAGVALAVAIFSAAITLTR